MAGMGGFSGGGFPSGGGGNLGGLFKSLGGSNPLGAGIAAGAGLLKAGLGFFQQAKGKKMLKNAKDPGYKIPKGYGKNLAQAEILAKTGMPSEQYNLAQQNILRNVGTATRQLGRSSNPSAGLASLLRGQNEGIMGLDVANAQARRQNILQAMSSRREMAQQQLAQQQYAQNRYFDKVNEANARIGAGTQNIFGGLSDIGSAGIMGSMSGQQPQTNTSSMGSMPNFNVSDFFKKSGMPSPGTSAFQSFPGIKKIGAPSVTNRQFPWDKPWFK
jgi:hypothetical protein